MTSRVETDYVVEEVSSASLHEAELAQFTEVKPLRPQVDELIRKYIDGELDTLPPTFNTLQPGEEQDEYTDNEAEHEGLLLVKLESNTTGASDDEFEDSTTPSVSTSGQAEQPLRGYRKRCMLSLVQQGLMGHANLSWVRGDVDMAEKLCFEIIRQQPCAPEPFFTLANIYEGRDTEKFLNILSIAAHLEPTNREHWIRLADLYVERGNPAQAIVFYSKAIRAIPKDYDIRIRKAKVLESMGQDRNAMFTLLKMINVIPAEETELCLNTARNVMRFFYDKGRPVFALEAMEMAFRRNGKHFTTQDLNVYFELLMLLKFYSKVTNLFSEIFDVLIEKSTDAKTGQESIICCIIPDNLLPEFRAKLSTCLIHLGAFHLLEYLTSTMHESTPIKPEFLELYIDVAEALMQHQKYEEGIKLLKPITANKDVDCPAFVWLRAAECLRHLKRTDEAIAAYNTVVDLAPFCYEAKFTLSALLKQQGRHAEAIKALEEYGDSADQPPNARLLYERCIMLQQVGDVDNFLELGYKLLSRYSLTLKSREELIQVAGAGSVYHSDGIKTVLQIRNQLKDDTDKDLFEKIKIVDADLLIEDEFSLFRDLMKAAASLRKHAYAQKLCFTMILTRRFKDYRRELEKCIVLSSYYNDDCATSFTYLRELIVKNPENIMLWNMLGLLVQKHQYTRYNRFSSRLMRKLPNIRTIRLFIAHYHLYSSSYKYSLNVFTPLYKEQPTAHIALCMASIFVQMAMQKNVKCKSGGVGQAVAFVLKYAELRGGINDDNPAKQEILYNIGRIYQQAGMYYLAIHYYEQGLETSHPFIEENEELLGLKEETAFNLHLMYKYSGNARKARQILHKYIVT